MTTINQALGDEIIAGGMQLVADDEAVYGKAIDVFTSQTEMFATVQAIARSAGADHIRLMMANRLGDLVVGILHGGDIALAMKHAVAVLGRTAPAVTVLRQNSVEGELQKQFGKAGARLPLKGSPPLQPTGGETESA